jgi:hypothetical protein
VSNIATEEEINVKVSTILVILAMSSLTAYAEIGDQCTQLSYEYTVYRNRISDSEQYLHNKYPLFYPFMKSCKRESDVGGCLMGKCAMSAFFEWAIGKEASCDDFIADAIRTENYQKTALSNMRTIERRYNNLGCR